MALHLPRQNSNEGRLDPMTDPEPMNERAGLVLEGMCPTHRTPLERRDDGPLGPYGWCETCNRGYASNGENLTTTFDAAFSLDGGPRQYGTITVGPAPPTKET